MDWLTQALSDSAPTLERLLESIKWAKTGDVFDAAKLSHVTGLCERIVDEAARLGVQLEVDPREWSK